METVGIIIPTKERFDKWVKTWGIPQEKYIHLDHVDKVKGQIFSKILKSEDWRLVDNVEDILKDVNLRIRII